MNSVADQCASWTRRPRSGSSKRLKKAAEEEGALLPLFVAPSQLKPFITKELEDGPLKPIDYQDGDRVVRGYDASALVAVCDIWLRAREAGALQDQQLAKAQKAEILTRALAHTAIVALVDEATGYEKVRPQNALQSYLEMLVRKELAAWAKKFPDEFYENIYKLKGWPWPGMGKNRRFCYSMVGLSETDQDRSCSKPHASRSCFALSIARTWGQGERMSTGSNSN